MRSPEAYDSTTMRWRLLTFAAVAMVAFYAGAVVDGSGTTAPLTPASISVPDSIPVVPAVPPGSVRVSWTYATAESHSDPLLTAAAIGAVAAALFLLARGAVLVARRARA